MVVTVRDVENPSDVKSKALGAVECCGASDTVSAAHGCSARASTTSQRRNNARSNLAHTIVCVVDDVDVAGADDGDASGIIKGSGAAHAVGIPWRRTSRATSACQR